MKKSSDDKPKQDGDDFYTDFSQDSLPSYDVSFPEKASGYQDFSKDERVVATEPKEKVRTASKKRKKKKWKKVCLVLLAIFLLLAGGIYYLFGGLQVKPLTSDLAALGIDPAIEELYKNKGVTNIALFGVDTRDYDTTTGRSDAIMILSVDRAHNQIKLTSILRDSYVEIEGHGMDKITHAYAYGGPELAIKTINTNFKLDIKNYATVNFSQMGRVIDTLGGVEIEISEAERVQINILANQEGMWAEELPSSGLVHLNGTQATAFSRIRSIDTDTARANRQRMVMEAVLKNVKATSIFSYPQILHDILPLMETSMDFMNIAILSPTLIFGSDSMTQYVLPSAEDNAYGGNVGSMWVWQYDIPAAAERLREFIYEEA